MKTVAIIAARMSSQRLPGKVLTPLMGVPMLEQMMRRLSRCRRLDEILIATSENPQDDRIVEFAAARGYLSGRGSENDVLGRYYNIAAARSADVVVRLTGDCPLIDPDVTDAVVERHLRHGNDLTSNVIERTFPRGLDTEVLSFSCLARLNQEAKEPLYREHVTNFVYDHPDRFKIENHAGAPDYSKFRLCVDTAEDLEVVTRVYEALYPVDPRFGLAQIAGFLEKNPAIAALNESVQQAKIFKHRTKA